MGSIDWGLGRATVEDLMGRSSELVDPAIANVDHALLVFALDNPPVRGGKGEGGGGGRDTTEGGRDQWEKGGSLEEGEGALRKTEEKK